MICTLWLSEAYWSIQEHETTVDTNIRVYLELNVNQENELSSKKFFDGRYCNEKNVDEKQIRDSSMYFSKGDKDVSINASRQIVSGHLREIGLI